MGRKKLKRYKRENGRVYRAIRFNYDGSAYGWVDVTDEFKPVSK